jgi:hypothetical protein
METVTAKKAYLSVNDQRTILKAYKHFLGGTPIEKLGLNDYQYQYLDLLSKAVSSGKTGSQISQETGLPAGFCCDFRKAKMSYSRITKEARTHKISEIAAKILQRDYGVETTARKIKPGIADAMEMKLAGRSKHYILRKGVSEVTYRRMERFEKLVECGVPAEEIARSLSLSINTTEKLIAMKEKAKIKAKTL